VWLKKSKYGLNRFTLIYRRLPVVCGMMSTSKMTIEQNDDPHWINDGNDLIYCASSTNNLKHYGWWQQINQIQKPQIMIVYVTKQPINISALFAMTVHHKTLKEDANSFTRSSLLCVWCRRPFLKCSRQHLTHVFTNSVYTQKNRGLTLVDLAPNAALHGSIRAVSFFGTFVEHKWPMLHH